MEQNIWQLQDAKSKCSQLVDSAMHHKPQFVTKHGSNVVVILSFEDYIKFIKPKDDLDLVSFFRNSPLVKSDLEFSGNKDRPREIEL